VVTFNDGWRGSIFVKTLTGQNMELMDCWSGMYGLELKEMIKKTQGIPVDSQAPVYYVITS